MSIEGMLCAAGLALLASGVLVRARAATAPRPAAATVTEAGPPQRQGQGAIGGRLPAWRVGTAALWLGVASLVAAGGVVFSRLMLFWVVS